MVNSMRKDTHPTPQPAGKIRPALLPSHAIAPHGEGTQYTRHHPKPPLLHGAHRSSRGEEDQHTTGHDAAEVGQSGPQLVLVAVVVAVGVGAVEGNVRNASPESSNPRLRIFHPK